MSEIDWSFTRYGLLKWFSREPSIENVNNLLIPSDLRNSIIESEVRGELVCADFQKCYKINEDKIILTSLGQKILEEWIKKEQDIEKANLGLDAKEKLYEIYRGLQEIFKKYMDTSEENCKLWCLWVIAAKFYQKFPCFPYLYLNAAKRSGKTRLLKLTAFLLDGILTTSLTEAVAFRIKKPLFFDEAESLDSKEKKMLAEILNFGYKRGGKVVRAQKIKGQEGGEFFVVKEFDVYRPMGLANISGLNDVLSDRCIVLVLKRSIDPVITKRLEIFEIDNDIKNVKEQMKNLTLDEIDNVLTDLFNHLNNGYVTYFEYSRLIIDLLNKTTLVGRDFELFLPIFIVASLLSKDLLDEIHKIALNLQDEKNVFDVIESRDIKILEFLYSFDGDYVSIKEIVKKFLEQNPTEHWFNERWLGRFLKRMQVIRNKRRVGSGIQVLLDKQKLDEMLFLYFPQTTLDTQNTQTTQKISEVSVINELGVVKEKYNNEKIFDNYPQQNDNTAHATNTLNSVRILEQKQQKSEHLDPWQMARQIAKQQGGISLKQLEALLGKNGVKTAVHDGQVYEFKPFMYKFSVDD
ncbi:MAG: hypothetical protein N3D75_00995 [Candidatus Aenigmarchaeota archaeon]|nr:hypothetical protein [Candidatus Aenigmarchaeota archaeon]